MRHISPISFRLKGNSNPNDKYVLSERALRTMNFDTISSKSVGKWEQLLLFSTNLDETGIKIHGLLRSFILNILIIRVAVPFNRFLFVFV